MDFNRVLQTWRTLVSCYGRNKKIVKILEMCEKNFLKGIISKCPIKAKQKIELEKHFIKRIGLI